MLNLESRMEILGITVFQDSDRVNQYYYLPGSPHISRESGVPLFELYSYRKGGEAEHTEAGGFLNMTVDVGLGSLKDRIESKLKEQFGNETTLASVPFTKGTARVIALGEDSKALLGNTPSETTPGGSPLVAKGPRFIENILGPGVPSLDGENRAIFSFSLSEDGAAFFLNLFNGNINARPVGVVYELEYVGLFPAYDLEITIDFKSSYDYMRQRFTLGTLFFKADMDNITEELKRNESIKIKETSRTLELSTPEAIQARQSHIDQLVKDLASGAMFQTSLTPGQPKVQGDTITAADPTTAVSTSASNSTQSVMDNLRQNGVASAVAQSIGQQLGKGSQMDSGGAAGASATPSGGTPASGGGTTPASGTPASQPTSAADVWNRLGRPQAAFVLKNVHQEEMRTVTYSLSQVTAQKRTVSPQSFVQFLADSRELDQHLFLVDLNHPFFQKININLNALDVDFAAEGITQMTVQLRYGKRPDGTEPKDTAEAILRSKTDSKDFTFFVDGSQSQTYEYKLIIDYVHDFAIGVSDPREETDWIKSEARSLSVSPRWIAKMLPVMLTLPPSLPEDVTEIQARVHYTSATHGIDDSRLVHLTAQNRTALVPIRLADAGETFEVEQTIFYADGTNEVLPTLRFPDPTKGEADDAVVFSPPRANRFDTDLIMQDPLSQLSSVLADLQVQQENTLVESRTFEMMVPMKREVWSPRLPQREAPAKLRYRQRRLFKDGGIETDDWMEAISPNLIVGVPAERVFTVMVTYLGLPPSVLGVSAIVADLEYQDPAGDVRYDQSASLLISDDPSTFTQEWKIRLPHGGETTYKWKTTTLKADGTEVQTEFQNGNGSRLILRLPPL